MKDTVERMIQLALALTSTEWKNIGLSTARSTDSAPVASGTATETIESKDVDQKTCKTSCIGNTCIEPTTEKSIIVERITSLFLVRIVACVIVRKQQQRHDSTHNINDINNEQQQQNTISANETAPVITFTNLSTSCICQQLLDESVPWPGDVITEKVIKETYNYVDTIISQYNDVPYHRKEHAYHVVISVNKLLDMMISGKDKIELPNSTTLAAAVADTNTDSNPAMMDETVSTEETAPVVISAPTSSRSINGIGGGGCNRKVFQSTAPTSSYVTYGLRHDPIALFSLVFASLIHDVEHKGIPNRQLAIEDDRLAILYNDQSMAENWSLYVGFSEFLHTKYESVRTIVFGLNDIDQSATTTTTTTTTGTSKMKKTNLIDNKLYRRFREIVIDLVLSTDISSPERMQINKSKWKEAFGDPYETIERKIKLLAFNNSIQQQQNLAKVVPQQGRRFSLTGRHIVAPRRASNLSTVSVVTFVNPSSAEDNYHCNGWNSTYQNDDTADDDNNSFSATPEHSDSENDNDDTATGGMGCGGTTKLTSSPAKNGTNTGDIVASVKGSVVGLRKFERRMSAASVANSSNTAKYRKRLGILRTVDISGETIEKYPRQNSINGSFTNFNNTGIFTNSTTNANGRDQLERSLSTYSKGGVNSVWNIGVRSSVASPTTSLKQTFDLTAISKASNSNNQHNMSSTLSIDAHQQPLHQNGVPQNGTDNPAVYYEADEPDDLRAIVVMETIISAADVAHNLQGWDQMAIWSKNLYLELRRAYVSGRGNDPSDRWYENQIGFLESYLLPLAHRLEDTGVFCDTATRMGTMFSTIVEANRDRWLIDGLEITEHSIEEGIKQHPPINNT